MEIKRQYLHTIRKQIKLRADKFDENNQTVLYYNH